MSQNEFDTHETVMNPAKLLRIYEFLLDQLDEGVHVVDKTGKTIIYNRKMAEMESMSKADVMNKDVLDVFMFLEDEHSTLLQALHNGRATHNVKQTYFNVKGNEITTINHTIPIVVDGETIGAVEIARDITKMERIQENILKRPNARFTFDSIIGESPAIKDVIEQAKRATRTNSSVLIVGETGTGKELIAQSIHNGSLRSAAPFVSQNCAALPETLIEGLLFGTTRGAFTGAVDRPGLIEQADGGTLLLDELNSLSIGLQAKLLRFIQEKTFRRLGDTKDRSVDVRIIATINEDPLDAISAGRLRKDLYYRLSVVTLFLPPLRERKEDIPRLVESFIHKYNQLFHMDVSGVSPEVMEKFLTYAWPGNVRELEHTIEGAMNMAGQDTTIEMSHLPLHMRRKFIAQDETVENQEQAVDRADDNSKHKRLQHQIREYERAYIEKVLAKHNGNISAAARELGMSRQNLQYRLRKLNVTPK
jgi:arginine utilization regulatory protein